MPAAPPAGIQPLYKGGKPLTDGLSPGQQWGVDSSGNRIAFDIPGVKTTAQQEQLIKDKEKEKGKIEFEKVLGEYNALYDKLYEKGGTPSSEAYSAPVNMVKNFASGELVGQRIGRMMGTENQTIRDSLNNKKPLLMAAMKKAAGLTGTELNSVPELKFYMSALGDLERSYEANKDTMKTLSHQFGTGKLAGYNQPSSNLSREEWLKRRPK